MLSEASSKLNGLECICSITGVVCAHLGTQFMLANQEAKHARKASICKSLGRVWPSDTSTDRKDKKSGSNEVQTHVSVRLIAGLYLTPFWCCVGVWQNF